MSHVNNHGNDDNLFCNELYCFVKSSPVPNEMTRSLTTVCEVYQNTQIRNASVRNKTRIKITDLHQIYTVY